MNTLGCILNSRTIQRYINHIPASSLVCFLNSRWNFARLTATKANLAITITNNSQCSERENTPTLNCLSNTVDLYQLFKHSFSCSVFLICKSHIYYLLKFEAGFTRGVCQCFNTAMIFKTAAVKSYSFNSSCNSALSN